MTSTLTRGPLPDETVAEVMALATNTTAHDGVPPLSEAPLLALRYGSKDALHLLERRVDRVVAYAQLDLGTSRAELVVAPEVRRQGIGRSMTEALLRESSSPLLMWAHGDLPCSRAFAEALGATRRRELLHMSTGGEGVAGGEGLSRGGVGDRPDAPIVAKRAVQERCQGSSTARFVRIGGKSPWEVGGFVEGKDEEAWVGVNAAAFVGHPEQGRMTREDLVRRMSEPWFDPDGLLAAREPGGGDLRGYVWTKVVGEVGEIYAIGVHPSAQGVGLGRALLTAGLEHLVGRGVRQVELYVEAEQERAVRMYAQAGFVIVGRDVQYGW